MNYKITFLLSIAFIMASNSVQAQQVDVGYLNPSFVSDPQYKYLRIGTSADHYAGLMYNVSNPSYGKGGNFSIFTYSNRDMVLRSGTGNIILNHSVGTGKIGIGTVDPLNKLHVVGDFYLQGTTTAPNSTWGTTFLYWRGHSLIMGSPAGRYAHNRLELKPGGSSSGLLHSTLQLYNAIDENNHQATIQITSSGNSYFNGGNVGIGTNNPNGYRLAVKGTIRAEEVRVDTGWADFVFEKDYPLLPLEELALYIEEHKHLPEIPTADQVANEGIEVGNMNKLLLQKIEELTLYILEQNKLLKEQQGKINQLEERINQLD